MNALAKASQDASRSFDRAAFAVKQAAGAPSVGEIVTGNQDGQQSRSNVGNAQEQLSYFKGWVAAAVNAIAKRVSGQEIRVARMVQRRMPGRKAWELKQSLPARYKAMGDQLEPIEDHALVQMFRDPNDLMVASSLIWSHVAALEITGQAFIWAPVVNGRRLLLPIPPHWIRGYEGSISYEHWLMQPPGIAEPKPIPSAEMLYTFYPHPADPRAVFSKLQAAADAVVTDFAIQHSQRRTFERAVMPKVVLTAGHLPGLPGGESQRPSLTPAQRSQLVNAIKTAYAGYQKWEEPLILDALIEKVDLLGSGKMELDWLSSSKNTKQRILQSFGVNEIILGEVESANRASSTVASEHFVDNTVNPIISLLSQSMTEWLGPLFASPGERLVI